MTDVVGGKNPIVGVTDSVGKVVVVVGALVRVVVVGGRGTHSQTLSSAEAKPVARLLKGEARVTLPRPRLELLSLPASVDVRALVGDGAGCDDIDNTGKFFGVAIERDVAIRRLPPLLLALFMLPPGLYGSKTSVLRRHSSTR